MFWKNIDLEVEEIYNSYGKLIRSIAYNTVHDHHLAEDITQETMVKIIKNPMPTRALKGNELKNYVARIAINTSFDFVKRLNKTDANTVFMEDEQYQELGSNIELEEIVIDRDSKEKLKTAIRQLDAKYRDPLTLHKLDGYTVSEVSALLSVPERTVKYRINRAMNILKGVLRKEDDHCE